MCTASWSAGQGRLSLCFNRDERKSRSEALPPRRLAIAGIGVLAAIDPDAGGTWLAVNEHGLCVFLLNNYGAQALLAKAPEHPRSRGELPLRLAACANRNLAIERLLADSYAQYQPFLVAFADREGVVMYSWDGKSLESMGVPLDFVTTSSFRTEEVQSYRYSRYQGLLAGRGALTAAERREFHVGMPHEDAAFDCLMLRSESRTHSVSTVEVDADRVVYRYEAVLGESRRLGEAEEFVLPVVSGAKTRA